MAKKVKGFEDFKREEEKESLKKTRRSFVPNSDQQQYTTNTRNEFDENTRKITALTKDEVEDKLDAIEGLEEGLGFLHDESPIKVKHLIEYLQKFDPEMSVELDKGGWEHREDPIETISNSGLFNVSLNWLFINN